MYIHNMILSLHNHIFILLIILISIPIRILTGYNLFGDPTSSGAQVVDKIIIYITFFFFYFNDHNIDQPSLLN